MWKIIELKKLLKPINKISDVKITELKDEK